MKREDGMFKGVRAYLIMPEREKGLPDPVIGLPDPRKAWNNKMFFTLEEAEETLEVINNPVIGGIIPVGPPYRIYQAWVKVIDRVS